MGSARRLKPKEQLTPGARYRLLAHLASGGMGAVYVGSSSTVGEGEALVAIKRAHAHLLEDETFREMFVVEARLASRIHHPNVVAVREVADANGELLIVMEYVESAPLSELLGACLDLDRRLPLAVAIRIVLDAALGLHAAHSVRDEGGRLLGMVHRDVSPQNVLVGLDGASRIVDFGVAKAIEREGVTTKSGFLKGKAAYMAPEYLDGRKASPQSDVFSLGVVAWEAITLRRLFRAENEVATMQNIMSAGRARRLSEVMSIDAGIEAAIAQALAKDPRERFPSARDFADALESAARRDDQIASPAEVGAVVDSILGSELAAVRDVIDDSLAASSVRVSRRRSEKRVAQPSDLDADTEADTTVDGDELVGTLKRMPEDADSLAATVPKPTASPVRQAFRQPTPEVFYSAPTAPALPVAPAPMVRRLAVTVPMVPQPAAVLPVPMPEPSTPKTSGRAAIVVSIVLALIVLAFVCVWLR